LQAGLGLVPEDRKRQGLVLSMSCLANGSLASLPRLTRMGFIRGTAERALVQTYVDRLRVKTPALEAPIMGLSGGNQQKIALAKWLARRCRVLIVDEPTRGIDIGAKGEIHRLLDQLACQGMAILAISSELPELIHLARRVLVLRQGTLAGELARDQLSEPAMMRLMMAVQ
jgi:ABC-type sugar transport system ATPase subunit